MKRSQVAWSFALFGVVVAAFTLYGSSWEGHADAQRPGSPAALPDTGCACLGPDWSPDGKRIAFTTNGDGNFEIYVMDADGSNRSRLTATGARDCGPDWSPDAGRIAFYSDRDGNREIYVMDSDGQHQTRLTRDTADDYGQRWSPDGTKIAFATNRDGNFEIYVMDADGKNSRRLTRNTAAEYGPNWSPDGSKIAFYSTRDGSRQIYVMTADGKNQTRLTRGAVGAYAPNWSPDGEKIAFCRDGNIYVMDPGGGNVTQLTDTGNDSHASWSPDEAKIAFHSARRGSTGIYVMNADGSSSTRISDGSVPRMSVLPRQSPGRIGGVAASYENARWGST